VIGAGLEPIGTTSHDALASSPDTRIEAYTDADLTGRVALVMGNEAHGLPDRWVTGDGPIRRWATIPHRGRSESLNVAMATTILVFEAARQRLALRP
jgi:TrmH family RNA methyltransferase